MAVIYIIFIWWQHRTNALTDTHQPVFGFLPFTNYTNIFHDCDKQTQNWKCFIFTLVVCVCVCLLAMAMIFQKKGESRHCLDEIILIKINSMQLGHQTRHTQFSKYFQLFNYMKNEDTWQMVSFIENHLRIEWIMFFDLWSKHHKLSSMQYWFIWFSCKVLTAYPKKTPLCRCRWPFNHLTKFSQNDSMFVNRCFYSDWCDLINYDMRIDLRSTINIHYRNENSYTFS